MKKLFLFLLFINSCSNYVLRDTVLGRKCILDKIINVEFDKNICDTDFSYINPYKFNNCNLLKKNIKNGLKMWYENNSNIKVFYELPKKNIYMNLHIIKKKKNNNIIGKAYRNCFNNKLINAEISINSNECFYPDMYLCSINNLYFFLIFSSIICFHLILPVIFKMRTKIFLFIIPYILFEFILSILIYIECDKCTPLKGVIAHEFGHVLGFDHPDQKYYFNLDGTYNNCGVNKKINFNYDKKSIMLSNENNLRTKEYISDNDKLGLYDIYPSCILNEYKKDSYFNKNSLFFNIFAICIIILPLFVLLTMYVINKFIKNKENLQNLYNSNNVVHPELNSV